MKRSIVEYFKSPESVHVIEIIGHLRETHWGKRGIISLAAQMHELNDLEFIANEENRYGELILGAGAEGPPDTKEVAIGFVANLPDNLPYTIRIICADKPNQLKVCPPQSIANDLYEMYPEIMFTNEPKPKLVIAISEKLEMLIGFRSIDDILRFCREIPPLRTLFGEANIRRLRKQPEQEEFEICFRKFLKSSKEDIKEVCNSITNNYCEFLASEKLFRKFHELRCSYPTDLGCMFVFVLNVADLRCGQSVYLPGGQPHVILKGDAIECSTVCKNSYRMAFTNRKVCIDYVMDCIDLTQSAWTEFLFEPYRYDPYIRVFKTPMREFVLIEIKLPLDAPDYRFAVPPIDSTLVVISGERRVWSAVGNAMASKGSILFIDQDAAATVQLVSTQWSDKDFLGYLVMVRTSLRSKAYIGARFNAHVGVMDELSRIYLNPPTDDAVDGEETVKHDLYLDEDETVMNVEEEADEQAKLQEITSQQDQ